MPDQYSKDFTASVKEDIVNTLQGNIEPPDLPDFPIDPLAPVFNYGDYERRPRATPLPGFWENAQRHFVEQNELAAINRFAHKISDVGPDTSEETVPEGWHPYHEENIKDKEERYWDYILDARSPLDLEYRRNRATEQAAHEELLAAGGFGSSLLGGAAGAIAGPTTLIPIGAAAKFGKFGVNLFKGLKTVAPAIVTGSFAHAAIIESARVGATVEQAIIDGAVDSAFGLGFYGAGRTLMWGAKASNFWKARKIVNVSYEGITVEVKADPNTGAWTGLVAKAIPGQVVAEADLKLAQAFLDDGAVQSGLVSFLGPIGKIPGIGSDLFKGLTSKSGTVRTFFNNMGNSSIVTGGVERGLPRTVTAEVSLDLITNEFKAAGHVLHNLYLESIGLTPGVRGSARAVVESMRDGISKTKFNFFRDVQLAIATGETSASKPVNEAVKLIRDTVDPLYKRFLESQGMPTEILKSKTGAGYLMRNYNLREMTVNPEGWVKMAIKDWSEQDAMKTAYLQPLDNLRASIKKLQADLLVAQPDQVKGLQKQIRQNKRQLNAASRELRTKMQNGDIDPILLSDRPYLNNDQLSKLKNLYKPIDLIEAKLKAGREELPGLTKLEQKASRERMKVMKAERDKLLSDLKAAARAGKIEAGLFYIKNGEVRFHNTRQELKFTRRYASIDQMAMDANNYYNKILNMTAEQVGQSMLSKMSGGVITDPTKSKSFMIRDKALIDNNFLSNDLQKNLDVYANVIGKRVALSEAFSNVNWNDGITGMGEVLTNEFQARKNIILKQMPEKTPARDKALLKLTNEQKAAEKQIGDLYRVFMGNAANSPEQAVYAQNVRNWTSMTMLRNVPLLQGGELFAVIFKQRVWPFVTGGLMPLLAKINPLVKSADMIENAAHANVGVKMTVSKMSSDMYYGAPDELKFGFTQYMQKAANISNLMSNSIANGLQTFSANVTQSRVIADMYAMSKGKLSIAKQKDLLMSGIDPKDFRKWINAFESGEGYKMGGGYVSKWYTWKDANLQMQMRRAIDNDIRGSILEGGLIDKPIWMQRNPLAALPFQFSGYAYAAFNKFTIPAAQQPSVHKAFSLLLMSGYGAMVEPMRAFQKGEEFEFDTEKSWDKWAVQGFLASGATGYSSQFIEMLDQGLGVNLMGDYAQAKYKRRDKLGFLLGPVGGLIGKGQDVFDMFRTGQFNQDGLTKAKNVLPIGINLALDGILNRMIKSSDLPKTKRDATKYSWLNED
jgi:hypothetical protein